MATNFELIKRIKDDNLLGRLVINLGFADETKVDECMMAMFSNRDNPSSLTKLLLEKEYLTQEDIDKVKTYKSARLLTCPKCKIQYNTILFKPDAKFFCHGCNTELEVPTSELDAGM